MIAYRLVDEVIEDYLDLIDTITTRSRSSTTTSRIGHRSRFGGGSSTSATTCCTFAARSPRPATRSARSSTTGPTSRKAGRSSRTQLEVAFGNGVRQGPACERRVGLLARPARKRAGLLPAKIANDQNEVMKRLTMVASLLLVPTFIVGLYGMNFTLHSGDQRVSAAGAIVGLAPHRRLHARAALVLPPPEVALALLSSSAVLHLPELQGTLGRHRPCRGAEQRAGRPAIRAGSASSSS